MVFLTYKQTRCKSHHNWFYAAGETAAMETSFTLVGVLTAVGLLGPVGLAISSTYFVLDLAAK